MYYPIHNKKDESSLTERQWNYKGYSVKPGAAGQLMKASANEAAGVFRYYDISEVVEDPNAREHRQKLRRQKRNVRKYVSKWQQSDAKHWNTEKGWYYLGRILDTEFPELYGRSAMDLNREFNFSDRSDFRFSPGTYYPEHVTRPATVGELEAIRPRLFPFMPTNN